MLTTTPLPQLDDARDNKNILQIRGRAEFRMVTYVGAPLASGRASPLVVISVFDGRHLDLVVGNVGQR